MLNSEPAEATLIPPVDKMIDAIKSRLIFNILYIEI